MKHTFNIAAVDLGASSGRVMLARFDGNHLTLEEVHRFPNIPVRVLDHLHWDVLRLFEEIKTGLGKAQVITPLNSLGLDTWGVDFALLDRDRSLVCNPYHYRDPRTDEVMERVFEIMNREEIFHRTGLQFMQFNSLFQLFSMRASAALEAAETFLMMPDLFNFWLTGRVINEYTEATTTQFYNPGLGGYDLDLLSSLGLPTDIFPEIVPPGTILGRLLPSTAEETGLGDVPVISPACHDTGSAVAAVPIENARSAYISSGTWSLIGVEVTEPVITLSSLENNFTNEGGVYGTIRFLKNVPGLWLLQECRRVWADQGQRYSWRQMIQAASSVKPFGPLIDPDHPDFLNPPDMPQAIRSYCTKTNQPAPESQAAILRCIFESLALKYRWVVSCLEEMLGYEIEAVHVIGGGSQNDLLCQLTANALGKPLLAGPVEATAIGNALVQAITLGCLEDLAEARSLVAKSFPVMIYEPGSSAGWDEVYNRFTRRILGA